MTSKDYNYSCGHYIVEHFFKLDPKEFDDSFSGEYPTSFDMFRFLLRNGFYAGIGANLLKNQIKISFKYDAFPLLIVVETPRMHHFTLLNKGVFYDMNMKPLEYYKQFKMQIYPIIKEQK